MRKATRKELVNKLLDAMFTNIKHSCAVEREVFIHEFVYCQFVLSSTFSCSSSSYRKESKHNHN